MKKERRNLLLGIVMFACAGIFVFFGAMILVFAIGEYSSASVNFGWIITLGAGLCLIGAVCAFFGFYFLRNKKQ